MEWTEKVIVITGATKGIGKGIANYFAKLDANVIVGYRSSVEEAQSVVEELKGKTGNRKISFERMDIIDDEAIKNTINGIVEKHKKIDVLVNNAGISYGGALIPSNDIKKWQEIINTNITGTLNCINAVSLYMLVERKGSIVNISSVAGLVGVERLSAYSASKAGVIGLTRSLGKEYAPFNVRVNAIAPGYIEDTGMVNRIPEKQMSKFSSQIAMKRLGKVQEIAATVAFLASEDASYITGQTVVVDGGLS